MLLTVANAFFVVAEFSLVTVDRAAIDQAATGGDRTARTVRRSLRELSFQLSAAQLGITLAALLTGYIAVAGAREDRLAADQAVGRRRTPTASCTSPRS